MIWNDAELNRLLRSPTGDIAKALEKRAIRIEATAIRNLSTHGRGRTYRLSNPTRTHQASAPGDPPAVDTGQLRASISHRIGVDGQGLFAMIGSNLRKARWLELGTARIAPRPFLRPALHAERGKS